MKDCIKCGCRKELDAFYQNDKTCKQCRSVIAKSYRESNKDKLKALQKSWKDRNQEKVKLRSVEYYKKNKCKLLEYNKKWCIEHPEKTKEYQINRTFTDDQKENKRLKYKEYCNKNRIEIKEKQKIAGKKRYSQRREYYNRLLIEHKDIIDEFLQKDRKRREQNKLMKQKKYKKEHPDLVKIYTNKIHQRNSKELTDSYIKTLLGHEGIKAKIVTTELIESYRMQIKCKRLLKQIKNGNNDESKNTN
jgi:hypothetical protein